MSTKVNGCYNNGETSPFEEVKIPVPWGHVSGKWWGSRNTKPVIAIHGWQDNAGTFDNLAPLLLKQGISSLLCIDLPGHGYSSHFPTGSYYYIFWDGLNIIRRIVKHYKWSKITIMGHSLGGGIAFLYSAVFPNEVDKFVTIDIGSPAVRDPEKILNALGANIDKFLTYDKMEKDYSKMPTYTYEDMIDIVYDGYKGSLTRESCETIMKRGMRYLDKDDSFSFSRDVRLKTVGMGLLTLEQCLMFASRIKCEALYIRAESGMTFENPVYYDSIKAAVEESASKFEYHLVPGTHHLHLNDATSVSDIIGRFIKS